MLRPLLRLVRRPRKRLLLRQRMPQLHLLMRRPRRRLRRRLRRLLLRFSLGLTLKVWKCDEQYLACEFTAHIERLTIDA